MSSPAWVAELHPDEVSSYRANPSTFVSREASRTPTSTNRHRDTTPRKGQTRLIEAVHSPAEDAEYLAYLRGLLELLAGLIDLPQKCAGCGKNLETGRHASRKTWVSHDTGTLEPLESFCVPCAKVPASNPPTPRTPAEKARIMLAEGLTQKDIAGELGLSGQQRVSNLLKMK
jgi:hypothetical protein